MFIKLYIDEIKEKTLIDLLQYIKIKYRFKRYTDQLRVIIYNGIKHMPITDEDKKRLLESEFHKKMFDVERKKNKQIARQIYEVNNIVGRIMSMLSKPYINIDSVFDYIQISLDIEQYTPYNQKEFQFLKTITKSDLSVTRRQLRDVLSTGMYDPKKVYLLDFDKVKHLFNDIKS